MRIVVWVIVICLVLATGFGGLYLDEKNPLDEVPLMTSGESKPDFFMDNITSLKLNDDGSIQYRLTADNLAHYNDSQSTKLKQPHLTLHHKTDSPWKLSAKQGTLLEGNSIIRFNNNVEVTQRNEANNSLTKLNTSELIIQPDRGYAVTKKPISITSAFGDTTATGLKAFFKANRIELLSEVNGVYNREKISRP